MESQTAGRRRRPDDTPETARAALRIPRGLLGPIVTTGAQDPKEKAPRHPRRLRGAIGGIVVEARAAILRARRPERQQQVDQVEDVDGVIAYGHGPKCVATAATSWPLTTPSPFTSHGQFSGSSHGPRLLVTA